MKILVGTDIIEIERIKSNILKYGDKFLNRVYTETEIEYCESKKDKKYESYAARFAAKEAIFKAINDYIAEPFNWCNIGIINEKSGKPIVQLKVPTKNIDKIDVSLSHSQEFAIASAIAVVEEN